MICDLFSNSDQFMEAFIFPNLFSFLLQLKIPATLKEMQMFLNVFIS